MQNMRIARLVRAEQTFYICLTRPTAQACLEGLASENANQNCKWEGLVFGNHR